MEHITTGDIVAIITALGSFVAILLTWKKLPHENRNLDAGTESTKAETAIKTADVTSKYQEIAMKSAVRITDLENKILALESKLDEQERKIDEQNRKIVSQDLEISRLTTRVSELEIENAELKEKLSNDSK